LLGIVLEEVIAMPLYEYQCETCGASFELLRRITDDSAPQCPSCSSMDVHRLVSQSSFVLKGTGWYVTDYARKNNGSDNHHGKGTTVPIDGAGSEGKGSEGEGNGAKGTTDAAKTAGADSKAASGSSQGSESKPSGESAAPKAATP